MKFWTLINQLTTSGLAESIDEYFMLNNMYTILNEVLNVIKDWKTNANRISIKN